MPPTTKVVGLLALIYEETDGCYAVVCYGYDAVGGVCVR